MTILFAPLATYDTTADADGLVAVLGFAVATGVPLTGGVGSGGALIFGDGVLELATTAEPVPGALADGSVYVDTETEMGGTLSFAADKSVFVFGDGWCGAAGSAICDGYVYVAGEAQETLDMLPGDLAAPITYYPWMYGLSGGAYERVVDTLALDTSLHGQPRNNVLDILALADAHTSQLEAQAKVVEVLRTFGVESHIVIIVQQESLALSSVMAGDFLALERVIDRVILEGHALSFLEAVSKVADVLAAAAVAEALLLGDTADVIAMSSAADYVYTAIERVLDSAVLFAFDRQSLTFLVSDSMALSDGVLSVAEMYALIRDGVAMVGRFRLDTGEYIAWVINTESSGVSTYTNYPFNSFAVIGGVAFGLTSTGMHALDADDDDGDAINARLRVGLTDMGTRLLKNVSEAYIGFTSDEKMLLRTITPNPTTGAREAALYEMKSVGNASLSPQRFETGKGVKAVDWDFELENVDGAYFELHSVEFLSVKMSRRTRS